MGKSLRFLQGLFASLASRITANARLYDPPATPPAHTGLLRLESICSKLMGNASESEQLRLATEVLQIYRGLETRDKIAFFSLLTTQFTAPAELIHEAYARYRASEDNHTLQHLFDACEPRRQELLRRLNRCEGATFELVKMRADLLSHLNQNPDLKPLDRDFAHLLRSWFNRGFLTLQSIDWSTPALILEKIIQYEAVHEISDWSELRKRLSPADRRCYAFFHPAIGVEPLIFVEVALCKGIPGNINEILAVRQPVKPEAADTAVFYSISNCQRGLKGISFGNFLIKQVAEELKQELPAIERFVTLSPVTRLSAWLAENASIETPDYYPSSVSDEASITISGENTNSDGARQKLCQLGAYYLAHVKDADGRPHDPVARFHIGNGAQLYRINWPGDTSEKGLQQSSGLMVNYLYDLDKIEANHLEYTQTLTVPCSEEVSEQCVIFKESLSSVTQKARSA